MLCLLALSVCVFLPLSDKMWFFISIKMQQVQKDTDLETIWWFVAPVDYFQGDLTFHSLPWWCSHTGSGQ